jgi:outer membrane immunogenic protein
MINRVGYALLSACASLTLCGAAWAADLPQEVQPSAPLLAPVSAYSWTGFYLGVNGGYAFGGDTAVDVHTHSARLPDLDRGSAGTLSPSGAFGGGQAGYNMQFGHFVLGVEGDIQGSGASDSFRNQLFPPSLTPPSHRFETGSADMSIDWFGTVRARAGVAWDRLLLYGTGGLAFGGVSETVDLNPLPAFVPPPGTVNPYHIENSDTRLGYAVGAGAEYAFTDHLSAKLEYQYVNLGSNTLTGPSMPASEGGLHYSVKQDADLQTIRAGVNYKF